MNHQKKSKKELILEMKALLLRIEELEAVERKYRALTDKIQSLAGQIVEQNAVDPVAADRHENQSTTVLVVDDNDIFRKYMQEALINAGYGVHAAGSAAEALQLLKDNGEKVALLISDVVMPEGGGSALYKTVKASYPHIKVLFVSGYTDEILIHTDVQEVIESKAAFLQKPFHVAELLEKVKQELSGK